MSDENSQHNQFWVTLKNYHKITVPKHIQNIIKYMGLDKSYILEEVNEQYKNNKSNDMNFDFNEIEKYVRSEEYIAVANGNIKDFFGPACRDPSKFFVRLGDKFIVKKILRIVKENRKNTKHWEPNEQPPSPEKNSENQINFQYDPDEEEKSIRKFLSKHEFPMDAKLDVSKVKIKVSNKFHADLLCPRCKDSNSIKIKKYLNASGTKMAWNIWNFDRHIRAQHSSQKKAKRQKTQATPLENQNEVGSADSIIIIVSYRYFSKIG